jgi:hypothetical protein
VPTDISADCGIALEVKRSDIAAVKSLFEKESITGVFQQQGKEEQ